MALYLYLFSQSEKLMNLKLRFIVLDVQTIGV